MAATATQLDLFERPRPLTPAQRVRTSIEAAKRMTGIDGATARGKVFEFIARRGERGATREEISTGLNMKIQTVCARVDELLPPVVGKPRTRRRLNLIYDSGTTRKGSSGSPQVVLRAKGT